MHNLVDYVWIGKMFHCTMHNIIDYLWIGKKINLQYAGIVKHDLNFPWIVKNDLH